MKMLTLIHRLRSIGPLLAVLSLVLSFGPGCHTAPRQSDPVLMPSPSPDFSVYTPSPALPFHTETQAAPVVLGAAPSTASSISYRPPLEAPTIISPSTENVEQRTDAFRPILPPSESLPNPVAPFAGTQQSDQQLNELNKRIALLEKTLAEKEEQLRLATQSQSAPNAINPGSSHSVRNLPEPVVEKVDRPISTRSLPAFAIAGVSVAAQNDTVRIEIADAALFTPGTWQYSPTAEETLRKIVGEIRANWPSATLEIEGHTDNLVTDPKNTTQKHDIATYKSMLIMQYFIKNLLWNSSKITSGSYGPSRPIADNGTPEGRAKNNRTVVVVKPGETN